MTDTDIDLSADPNMSVDANKNEKIPVATATAIPYIGSQTTDTTVPSNQQEPPTQPILRTSLIASFSTSNVMTSEALQTLRDQGFPMGLAQELGNTKATYPLRFWIIDNSGSMMSTDGNELRGTREKVVIVPCTRWRELQTSIEYHAELAGLIGATTIFRMLNDPGTHIGPQEFSIGDTTGGTSNPNSISIQKEVSTAISIVQRAKPNGVTPLTYHLKTITNRIKELEPVLRRQGQKAVVVIATDGLPSDDQGSVTEQVQYEFVEALKQLQRLPVWVVIRLCTDDDTVSEYYNDLDKVLELPLECIDDYLGEAKEIMAVNKWLNYALPLHRCREMGYQHRLFDLLDERQLTKDELYEFLTLLFGTSAFRNAPDINTNWTGFYNVLKNVIQTETQEWNPTTGRRGPWIDMKQLSKTYGVKTGLFGLGRKR